MFFLGHMAWAYVWAVIFVDKRGGKLFVPAVLVLGILPDIDILLAGFGVVHHTFTHSLFFWLVIFAPLLIVFRRRMVPYLVAVVQHFAFGDFIFGSVMLFWPFSLSYFGFQFDMVSPFDVAFEIGGLLLAAGIISFNGDLRRLLSRDMKNVPMLLPFLAVFTSMLFFTVDWPLVPLAAYIVARKLLTVLVSAHLALAVFLVASTVQGFRSFFSTKKKIFQKESEVQHNL